ncbi:MAG TPA: STAS domain-containing protein [Tepidisphaeraceae bacterium]|nr:STAS domain-containing protein [Tepidisphaeraceae bacterium]
MTTGASDSDLVTASLLQAGVVVGDIHGEVDLNNSPSLRSRLLEALRQWKPTKLVLNMSKVPYIDSSAIAVLVEVLREIRRSGGKVLLVELQPRVKGLLEIARLDSVFVIAKDQAEALQL